MTTGFTKRKGMEKEINIYKPYLKVSVEYKGGKTLNEIQNIDKPIYKLSSNENLLGSSPLALAAIMGNIENLNSYPDRTPQRLQNKLSEFYQGELSPNQFICGPSGSEVLELIIRAFMGEGLECLISNPAFLVYQMFSEKQGGIVKDIPLKEPDFGLDVDGLLNAITDKTRILFLTSPNNPTGSYIPEKELDRIVDSVPDHVIVVIDEVYFQFADAHDFCRPLKYVKQGKNVVGINSFSKAYGLAGLRMGYAYTTEKIADYVRQLSKPFLVNLLGLEAAIAALDDDQFIQETVELVQKEKQKIYNAFDRLKLHYWKTQGNFILTKPKMDASDFEDKMFQEGIMVRPVANFGAPGCVRITIGTAEANDAMIAALETIMK